MSMHQNWKNLNIDMPESQHDCSAIGEGEHFVQFYEDERYLIQSVGSFIETGFAAGEAALVIATAEHLASIEEYAARRGCDLKAARARGDYVTLEARSLLSSYMVNGAPDEILFIRHVGGLISEVARGRTGARSLRVFGEMVALLCMDGDVSSVVHLEKLWNALQKTYDISLFCAYPLAGLGNVKPGEFMQICKEHSRVLPAESYLSHTTVDGRLRAIAQFQYESVAGQAERERRAVNERGLRKEKIRQELAASLSRSVFWVLDPESNFISFDEEFAELMEIAVDQPFELGDFMARIAPADRQTVEQAIKGASAGRSSYRIECGIRTTAREAGGSDGDFRSFSAGGSYMSRGKDPGRLVNSLVAI